MKWQEKLTKEELKHVRDYCRYGANPSVKEFKSLRLRQKERNNDACFLCRSIAIKLGLEE
jgi:hypothetical protein